MLVDSVMSRPAVTIEPHRSARAAAQLMRERRFRHLPVVRDGYLVGIVSNRDVVGRGETTVGDAMRNDVISVSPSTPIEVAAGLMLDNKIGALPVIADGIDRRPIGIVTQSDLFAVLARLLGSDAPSTCLELRLDDLSRRLAQVATLAYQCGVTIVSVVTVPASPDVHVRSVVQHA